MPLYRSMLFIDDAAYRIDDGINYVVWRCEVIPDPDNVIDHDDKDRILSLYRESMMFGEQDLRTLVRSPWDRAVMRFGEFIKMIQLPVSEDDISTASVGTFDLSASHWTYDDYDDEEHISDEEELVMARLVAHNPIIYEVNNEQAEPITIADILSLVVEDEYERGIGH